MKLKNLSLALAAIFLTIFFVSCKKDNNALDFTDEMSSQSDDQSRFNTETDLVINETNVALESSTSFSGRGNDLQFICDATIVVDSISICNLFAMLQ